MTMPWALPCGHEAPQKNVDREEAERLAAYSRKQPKPGKALAEMLRRWGHPSR